MANEPPSISITVGSLRQAVYDALQNWDYDGGTSSDLTDHIMEWIRTNAVGPPSDSPWGSRDDLRRFALDEQRLHDPAQQGADAWPDRCALCHYTRHPCSTYELATAVLWLLDEGRSAT